MQTKIRLLLKEQSDQGLHNLPFYLHMPFRHITALQNHVQLKFNFKNSCSKYFRCPKINNFLLDLFKKFTVTDIAMSYIHFTINSGLQGHTWYATANLDDDDYKNNKAIQTQ